MNRRSFIKNIAGASLAAGSLLTLARANPNRETSETTRRPNAYNNIIPPERKVRLAFIGCGSGTLEAGKPRADRPYDPARGVGGGGRGIANIEGFIDAGAEIAVLCDVNDVQSAEARSRFPKAPYFRDYRRMFDEAAHLFDAVVVTTVEHMHYPPALLALNRSKHIYVEKPLTHTIAEARSLREAAARTGLVTQLGNQGHAGHGTRLVKEWVDAGIIGAPREVIIWSSPESKASNATRKWPPAEPVPAYFDWNLWKGVAPDEIPYNAKMTNSGPGNSPGSNNFWHFGCGIGGMGSHLMDAPWWALELGGNCKVSADISGWDKTAISIPGSYTINWEIPSRGNKPPCKMKWHQRTMPELPRELGFEPGVPPSIFGFLIIGDKGGISMNDPYCTTPRLLPAALRQQERENPVPRTIPRIPKGDQYAEWLRAIQGIGPAPGSNIVDYSASQTETILLANVALRTGRAIEWDSAAGACVNDPEANQFLTKTYRKF